MEHTLICTACCYILPDPANFCAACGCGSIEIMTPDDPMDKLALAHELAYASQVSGLEIEDIGDFELVEGGVRIWRLDGGNTVVDKVYLDTREDTQAKPDLTLAKVKEGWQFAA